MTTHREISPLRSLRARTTISLVSVACLSGAAGVAVGGERVVSGPTEIAVTPDDSLSFECGASQFEVLPDGTAIYVWADVRFPNCRIMLSERPAGGAWSAPRMMSRPGTSSHVPELVTNRRGEALLAWTRGHISGYLYKKPARIQAVTRSASGRWSAPRNLNAPGELTPGAEGVAISPTGAVSVSWAVFNRALSRTVAVRVAQGHARGVWRRSVPIVHPGEFGSNAVHPRVGYTNRSRLTAFFAQNLGATARFERIFARDFRGGRWSKAYPIGPGNPGERVVAVGADSLWFPAGDRIYGRAGNGKWRTVHSLRNRSLEDIAPDGGIIMSETRGRAGNSSRAIVYPREGAKPIRSPWSSSGRMLRAVAAGDGTFHGLTVRSSRSLSFVSKDAGSAWRSPLPLWTLSDPNDQQPQPLHIDVADDGTVTVIAWIYGLTPKKLPGARSRDVRHILAYEISPAR